LPQHEPGHRSSESRGYGLLAAALVITALTYAGTLRFGFVYDDAKQIFFNSTLTTWKTLPSLFVSHSWKFMQPDWAGNYYRPVFMSWLLINRMLLGLHPALWHATTVLLHLLATLMAFVVARQILKNGTLAAFVALLFGLHPIHIESVAWVSGLTDPLMAFFTLAAFWAWFHGEKDSARRRWWQLLAALLYAAGCLSKEAAFFLPVMIVAYHLIFGREERTLAGVMRTTVRVWPLWITAVAYIGMRMYALHGFANPVGTTLRGLPLVLTIPAILWKYMALLIWPVNMSLFYDLAPVTSFSDWRFWLAAAWLLFAVVAWRVSRRVPIVGFALLWIFVFLSPALIGLPVFQMGDWVHDRYLYLSSFGFCLLLVYAIDKLPSQQELFGYRAAPMAVIVILSAAMAFGTSWQQQYWSNSLLIFAHSVNVAPRSALAKFELASIVSSKGDRENARRLYEEAIAIEPDNWKYNISFGLMLYDEGDFRLSERYLAHAVALDSSDANANFNLGMVRFKLGNYAEAEESFREATRKSRGNAGFHYWLGRTLEAENQVQQAQQEYAEEIALYPKTDTDAQQRLAAMQRH
jgi:hypothetical protein